jgi:hypothetical protein
LAILHFLKAGFNHSEDTIYNKKEIKMNVEAFLLCDAATDQQGKLNVLGAFDSIYTEKVPTIHPACAIVARIRFEKAEEGSHPVKITIIDEDGKSIGPRLDTTASVRIPDGMVSIVSDLILHLQRIPLTNYGGYRIDLAIDGQIRASLPLNVMPR